MNILPFPRRDATVKHNPLALIARRALAGDPVALGDLIAALGVKLPEILLAKRAIGAELLLDAGEVELHKVGQLARALLFTPVWVIHVRDAIERLSPRNFHRLSYILPYSIQPTHDTEQFCIVNRGYKPIGLQEDVGFVRYEQAAPSHIHSTFYHQLQRAGAVTPGGYFTSRESSPSGDAREVAEYRRRIRILLSPWLSAGSAAP